MKHQYINFEYLHKDFNVEMATLSMVTGKCARGSEVKDQGFKSRSHLDFGKDFFGCYLFRTSSREANRNWSKAFEGSSIRSRNRFRISANVKRWKNHDYPWPGDIDPNFTGSYLNSLQASIRETKTSDSFFWEATGRFGAKDYWGEIFILGASR